MDSFLSLFDPNDNNDVGTVDDFSHCLQLPPEPQAGNIEYKLKLVNPSKLRFQHLVTQVKNYNFFLHSKAYLKKNSFV